MLKNLPQKRKHKKQNFKLLKLQHKISYLQKTEYVFVFKNVNVTSVIMLVV